MNETRKVRSRQHNEKRRAEVEVGFGTPRGGNRLYEWTVLGYDMLCFSHVEFFQINVSASAVAHTLHNGFPSFFFVRGLYPSSSSPRIVSTANIKDIIWISRPACVPLAHCDLLWQKGYALETQRRSFGIASLRKVFRQIIINSNYRSRGSSYDNGCITKGT